jgi:hypothetical protein
MAAYFDNVRDLETTPGLLRQSAYMFSSRRIAQVGKRGFTEITAPTRGRHDALIEPTSEHAIPAWIKRTAIGDILKQD